MGTSAMDHRAPQGETPLCTPLPSKLRTSKPPRLQTSTPIPNWMLPPPHSSIDTHRSPKPQKVPKPPPGKQLLPWAPPNQHQPGLLTTFGEDLAASSSHRAGGRGRAAPTPAAQPPLPVPRKRTTRSSVGFKNSPELLIMFCFNRKHPWD